MAAYIPEPLCTNLNPVAALMLTCAVSECQTHLRELTASGLKALRENDKRYRHLHHLSWVGVSGSIYHISHTFGIRNI